MIFLGTLNQTNKRNWATAAVGLADSYRLLTLHLLELVFLVVFCVPLGLGAVWP